MSKEDFIEIDGTILEGGGQLMRNCIAYSAIFKKPVKIVKIRGGRSKGGLKKQHLAGILAAAKCCSAEVTGAEIGSTELTFRPGEILSPPHFKVDIGSAGACSLVIQILLPILLHSKNSHMSIVKIIGGTNVSFSPPIDTLKSDLLPRLRAMGIFARIDIDKRGYMPRGGGEVLLTVFPLQRQKKMNRIAGCLFTENRLNVPVKVTECILYGMTTPFISDLLKKAVVDRFGSKCFLKTDIETVRNMKTGPLGITLVQSHDGGKTGDAITSSGSALSHYNENRNGRDIRMDIYEMIEVAERELVGSNRFAIDEYLQDQLIIFMALAKNASSIATGEITLHTRTAIHFAEMFTSASFIIEESKIGGGNIITCIPAA